MSHAARWSILSILVLAAGAIDAFGAGPGQKAPSSLPVPDVPALLDRGLYDQADQLAQQQLDSLTAQGGTDSLEIARASDLLVTALLLNGKGTAARTLTLAVHTLRQKESRIRSTHPDLIPSLNNLCDALLAAGEYGRAIESAQRAVALAETYRADQNLPESLDHLGAALMAAERHAEALSVLERSLEIRGSAGSQRGTATARTLMKIGRALQRKGDYERAGPILQRALSLQEASSPDHPACAEILTVVGLQLWFEGRIPEAGDVAAKAVAVAERALRPDHPTVALALRYRAGALLDLGDWAQAQALLERALGIAERTFGPDHFETWAYVNDLAMSETFLGRYTVARTLSERALKIARNRLGQSNERVATAMNTMALVDAHLGDYASARSESLRATTIWQRVLGRDHPFVAEELMNLAAVYREQGAAAEALPLLRRALTIRERRLGAYHRSVATTLSDLAAVLRKTGQLTAAQSAAERAVRIWEQAGAPDAPEFATVLEMYAELQADRGDAATARVFYERALTIEQKAMGRSHPMVADTQVGLATALADLGDRQEAIRTAIEAETAGRNHLRLMLRDLPERQSLDYAKARRRGLDLVISLAAGDAGAVRDAFDALVRSRALVLDEMAARRRVRTDTLARDVAPHWAALTSARQRLANLVVRGPGSLSAGQYADLVADARRAKESAERELARRSAAFRDERLREEIGLDQVREALPPRSALVAVVRITRTAPVEPSVGPAATRLARRGVPWYVAFVLRQDRSDVSMISLGSAITIDGLVSRWRREVTAVPRPGTADAAERAYQVAGTSLRQRVWDPLTPAIGNAATVFVVPDGSLDVVSLAALPVGQSAYLIEQGPVIHYLSAERDLVAGPPAPEASRSLLALGGAAFDDDSVFMAARETPLPNVTMAARPVPRTRGGCGDLTSLHFSPLDSTAEEVRDIVRLWTGPGAQVLVRGAATERAFKQLAPGHRVLHLATHGFFLQGACDPAAPATRGVGGLASASAPRGPRTGTTDNPLLLSGLALAGANRRALAGPGEEDGILTAEEVTSLDLSGVEWAVLSACDTALGVVKAGEGVFGLRRAFQIAGVRTVIMSLWSVEDRVTREWMSALYDGRLRKHLTTADAVNQAALAVLRARRTARKTTHPFYWAGFVAAGDWR